ncbi:hypothetical protein [Thaumasiovibrio sp. DFM-14]|uniref:hypothetical protein n=1 Tax=Thaumasiovibrio sp. DFM-14 TaxID=3384792 RepID=UPI0039A2441E
MSQSIYLKLAVIFIRLDIHREQQAWRQMHRRIQIDLPSLNSHLLRDIGIEPDGRMQYSQPTRKQAQRTMRHLRRTLRTSRIT